MKTPKDTVTDIRPAIAKDAAEQAVATPASGDPRDFSTLQLQEIVRQGQESVQALLTESPTMLINLANASQNLGSMRMLLAIRLEEEASDDTRA